MGGLLNKFGRKFLFPRMNVTPSYYDVISGKDDPVPFPSHINVNSSQFAFQTPLRTGVIAKRGVELQTTFRTTPTSSSTTNGEKKKNFSMASASDDLDYPVINLSK